MYTVKWSCGVNCENCGAVEAETSFPLTAPHDCWFDERGLWREKPGTLAILHCLACP